MASLKYHLLREVADDVRDRSRWSLFAPIITSLALSGKEPLLIVRHIIQNEVVTVNPYKDGHRAHYAKIFQPILQAKWARKLRLRTKFHGCHMNFFRFFEELTNKDLTELLVTETKIANWPKIFKMFPNLVSLDLTAFQLGNMLRTAPNKLAGLELIGITFLPHQIKYTNVCFADTCKALCKHQSKYPALEVVHLKEVDLTNEFEYPKPVSVIPMPSVKHLKMAAVHEYTSFNFSFLTTMQKLFPSLETLDMDVEANLDEEKFRFENIDNFYKAFRSLNVGFELKINYREKFSGHVDYTDKYRNHVMSKGTVTSKNGKLMVATCLPGKTFIREVTIKNHGY